MLAFMRHGPAEDDSPSGGDFDRALTSAGRLVVLRSAALLTAAVAPRGWRIFASPFVRARQTAELMQQALTSASHAVHVEEAPPLGIGAPSGAWLAGVVAAASANPTEGSLLVGHQPSIEAMATSLVTVERAMESWPAGFRTAMIALLAPTTSPPPAAARWSIAGVFDPHRP